MLNTTILTPLRIQLSPLYIAFVFLVVFSVFLSWHFNFSFGFVDETYIPMVVAHQTVSGDGLVFYPQQEPFDTVKSPLWITVLCAAEMLYLSMPFIAYWISMICAVATLMLTLALYIQAYSLKDTPTFWNLYFFPGLAALLIALDAVFIAGSASGLEVMSHTLIFTALCYGCMTRISPQAFCLLFVCLCFLHPASIVFFPVIVIRLLLMPRSKDSVWRVFAVWFIIPYAIFLFLYSLWFEQGLPFSMVTSAEQIVNGTVYCFDFFQPRYLVWMALIGLLFERMGCRKNGVWIIVFVMIHSTTIIISGGGTDDMHRELIPVIPVVTVVSVRAIQQLADWFIFQKTKKSSGMMVVFTQFLLSLILLGTSAAYAIHLFQTKQMVGDEKVSRIDHYFKRVTQTERDKQLGKWLRANYSEDTIIAVPSKGTVPYFSGMHCYNFDAEDVEAQADFILNQKPQLIFLFSDWRFSALPADEDDMDYSFEYPAQQKLLSHPRFKEDYTFISQSTDVGFLHFYERNP